MQNIYGYWLRVRSRWLDIRRRAVVLLPSEPCAASENVSSILPRLNRKIRDCPQSSSILAKFFFFCVKYIVTGKREKRREEQDQYPVRFLTEWAWSVRYLLHTQENFLLAGPTRGVHCPVGQPIRTHDSLYLACSRPNQPFWTPWYYTWKFSIELLKPRLTVFLTKKDEVNNGLTGRTKVGRFYKNE